MKCTECGRDIPSEFPFCGFCGAAVHISKADSGNEIDELMSTWVDELATSVDKRNKARFANLSSAASHGSVCAKYRLAEYYLYGQGVDQDESRAIQLMNEAAECGHIDAIEFFCQSKSLASTPSTATTVRIKPQREHSAKTIHCQHADLDYGEIESWLSGQLTTLESNRASRISPDTDLRDEIGMDDLDMIKVVLAIENELDIDIYDHEAETLRTLNDFVLLVRKKFRHAR